MWLRLWAKIRPFNINTEQDERATRTAFDEIMAANGIKTDRVVHDGPVPIIEPRNWMRREGWR